MWCEKFKYYLVRVNNIKFVGHSRNELFLTLSALWTKTDTFANIVDPDETAHH